MHGTICDVHRGRSRRPLTTTSPVSLAMVLERFTTSPRKSATQCACDTVVSSTSVQRIMKAFKWKVYIPRLLHAINDNDPDHQMQFCEWFQQMVNKDEEFVTKIVWSGEAQFKLNGTVNRHNCVYWAPENLHVHFGKAVNLLGVNVWCGLSARGLIGPFFCEDTVTGEVYLEICYTHPFYQLYVHLMKTVRSSTNKPGHPHTTTETCGLSWMRICKDTG